MSSFFSFFFSIQQPEGKLENIFSNKKSHRAGGKAPAIVCEDANLQNAAIQCVVGAFLYSGQICMSTERVS